MNKVNNQNKESFIKNNYTWIVSSLIVAVYMFVFLMIFNVNPFGTSTLANADCYHQMSMMLATLHDKMRGGEGFFYSWNSGLGGDFLPTYFYYIASPINLLIYFVDKEDINTFVTFTVALKIVFAAGAFGYFISRRNGKVNNNIFYIALSCAYGLSNYMCAYYYEIMWTDAIMVFPLIILGYEKMIKERKPLLYILTLAYSLYCNYYIAYINCLFLVIWFLMDNHKNIKKFFGDGIRFAISSILSAGIVAISLVSSFVGLTKTVSYTEEAVKHSWYGNIFAVIRKMYIFATPVVTSNDENDANIFCGTIVILTLFTFLLIKEIDIWTKIKRLALVVFLFISMNEALLNYVWHGFHKQHGVPNRFGYLLIFIMLITAADVYEHLNKSNMKAVVFGLAAAEILPVISYVFIDFDSFLSSSQVMLLTAILTLVYAIFLLVISNDMGNKGKRILGTVLSCIMIIEILFNSMITFKQKMVNPLVENSFLKVVSIAKERVDEMDKSLFYRSDIAGGTSDNANMYHNMKGIAAFNSTVNVQYVVFSQYMGDHTGKNHLIYNQSKEFMDDLVGIKYVYIFEGNDDYDYNPAYEELFDSNGVIVLRNNNALSIGYGVSKNARNYTYLEQDELIYNINSLIECLTYKNDILTEIYPEYNLSSAGCGVATGDTSYLSLQYEEDDDPTTDKELTMEFEVPEDGIYYVDLREHNEDEITIKINNEVYKQSIWLTNGLSSLGDLKKGDKVSVVVADNKGVAYQKNSTVSEVKLFVYKLNLDNVHSFREELAKNQLVLDKFSDDSFSGKVTLADDQLLMLSIPYDKGWHVYENGKELKTEQLASTFLALDLGSGEHSLTFKYIPQGLYIGIIITLVSWMLLAIFIVYIKKHPLAEIVSETESDKETDSDEEKGSSLDEEDN